MGPWQAHGMRRFVGRGVIVTGGASGIGAATAHRFLAEGAHVLIADVNPTALARTMADLSAVSVSVYSCVTDVTDVAQVEQLVRVAQAQLPRLDVLINNAGIAVPEPFLQISEQSWDRTLDINLKGMFLVSQRIARAMVAQGSGTIVFTASTNGLVGEEQLAHYNASKGGTVLLTKSLAIELAPHGIRVNAVCPGFIRTPLTAGAFPDESYFARYAREKIPLGRVGRPEDVAAVFAFLASDDAAFITGECVVVDGGQLTS